MAEIKLDNRDRLSKRMSVRFGPDRPSEIGFIKNLSLTGIAMSSRTVFPVDTRLMLSFLTGSDPVNALGVVRWKTEAHRKIMGNMGASNLDMGIELLERPQAYVNLFTDLVDEFQEYRQEQRFDKVFSVTLDSPTRVLEEYTCNISSGGTYIETLEPLGLNSLVEVRILIIDIMQVIHAEARVVHVVDELMSKQIGMNPGMGVQFTRFFDDGDIRLREYVDGLLRPVK